MTDIPTTITRVVVVEHQECGNTWADSWDIHIQDDGHTLKLFAKGYGRGQKPRMTRLLRRFVGLKGPETPA